MRERERVGETQGSFSYVAKLAGHFTRPRAEVKGQALHHKRAVCGGVAGMSSVVTADRKLVGVLC